MITRDDLAPSYQAVQSSHASIDLIFKYDLRKWHTKSNTIVILSVSDEQELLSVERQLIKKGVDHCAFREPDVDYELTAIALLPSDEARRFTGNYKLAMKNYVPIAQSGRAGGTLNHKVPGSNPGGDSNNKWTVA